MKRAIIVLITIFLIGINGFSQDSLKLTEKKEVGSWAPPPPPPNSPVDEENVSQDENKIFSRVEVEAQFPGGDKAWRKYLEKNLNTYVPGSNKAPRGRYVVIVEFIVSKDGSINDAKAYLDPGYGTAQEVIRVIKTGPKWIPAMQNGRPVNAYRKQPIAFIVE